MKLNILIVLALMISLGTACTKKAETNEHPRGKTAPIEIPADTIKKSIPKETHAQVGNAHVMIRYHAPAVRGRTIWGGLVPYGEVWVTGAHSATSLELDEDFIIADKMINAGKYALFTIPGQEKWTIIINRNWDQHLADKYDQKDDVIRLEVIPQQLSGVQERLKYAVVAP